MSDSEVRAKRFERYKILWDISEASPIIRRYFAMNFFDGVLTALGIVLPGLIATIFDLETFTVLDNTTYFLTGLTTAVAIGISGLTGSHLAESAERKLNVLQMKQVLGLKEEENNDDDLSEEPKWSEADLSLALGRFEKTFRDPKGVARRPSSLHLGLTPDQAKKLGINIQHLKKEKVEVIKKEEKKKAKYIIPLTEIEDGENSKEKDEAKTIFEEAQDFAGKIAALVDGLSPFLGVMVVIIPFMINFAGNPSIAQFIISYFLSIFVLFMLGRYLAKLSKASIAKYGLQMVGAAVITSVLTMIFQILINR